jgi:hypothetical protein
MVEGREMQENCWFLGHPPRIPIPGAEGVTLHVGSNVHHTVAFLGFADPNSPGGINCQGTGFFVHHEMAGYLVTARHVARLLEDTPFVVRVNRRKGTAELLSVDNGKWEFHPDSTVDAAALPFELSINAGFESQYLQTNMFATPKVIEDLGIDVGDFSYTVGLFRYIYGNQRNFPLVHTGNIALLPPAQERIPVWNKYTAKTELVEGYLVESRAIDGASGSPVLTRASARWGSLAHNDPDYGKRTPILAEARVRLLGLFQGAWFSPPDPAMKPDAAASRQRDIVPVGIGIVVPAFKIIELLEIPALKEQRAKKPPIGAQMLSTNDQDSPAPQASDDNPKHQEDFTRLVGVAARKPPQGDQT